MLCLAVTMASQPPKKKAGGVVTSTLVKANTVRMGVDGSMSASGVKSVTITESTRYTAHPSERDGLLESGQSGQSSRRAEMLAAAAAEEAEGNNKPVTVTRAFRKLFSWGSGRRGRGFFSGKRDDDRRRPILSEMTVDDALEIILEEGDGEYFYGWWTLICTGVLSIYASVIAFEYNMLTFVAPCACVDFFPDASDSVLALKEAALWTAFYTGFAVGTMIMGPLADAVGRWRILFVSSLMIVVFGLLSAVGQSYEWLVSRSSSTSHLIP